MALSHRHRTTPNTRPHNGFFRLLIAEIIGFALVIAIVWVGFSRGFAPGERLPALAILGLGVILATLGQRR